MMPGRIVIVSALVVAAALLAARPAHAGRPLQSEDAGVIERGACEVEGAALRASAPGVRARESALQLSCDAGARTQLAIAVGRVSAEEERVRVLELTGKTNLWQGEEDALTLAYAVVSEKVNGQSLQHAATEINLVYSRALAGKYTLHANLGHAREEVLNSRTITWAFGLEHSGLGSLAPMVEMFGDDESGAWWNLGLRYTVLPERFFIDGSYGRQMTLDTVTLRSIGFKLAF